MGLYNEEKSGLYGVKPGTANFCHAGSFRLLFDVAVNIAAEADVYINVFYYNAPFFFYIVSFAVCGISGPFGGIIGERPFIIVDGLSVTCVCACGGNPIIIGKGGGKCVFPFQIAVGILIVGVTGFCNSIRRSFYGNRSSSHTWVKL